ncbi:MAG: hypothetical protein AMXMBFR77_28070 [Phycisphaerales bacterium]
MTAMIDNTFVPRLIATLGRLEQRQTSKILDQFYDRDFSYITSTVIPQLFPHSADQMCPRPVPVARQLARQHATAYLKPPDRKWLGLSEAQAVVMARIYEAMGMRRVFLRMHRRGVLQQTMIGLLWPRKGGGFVPRLYAPHQFQVDPHPIEHENIQRASEIRVRVSVSATDDSRQEGILVMRPDRIYVLDGEGEKPVWGDSTANPFDGAYPAWALQLSEPPEGSFAAKPPLDVAFAQIALTVGFTDTEFIGRFTSWGQDVFKYIDTSRARELLSGPDRPIALATGEEFQHVARSSSIEGRLKVDAQYLETVAALNNVAPETLLKGSRAQTALGKLIERSELQLSRVEDYAELRAAETGFYAALARCLRWGAMIERFPVEGIAVDCQYREPDIPVDPEHDMRAKTIAYSFGLRSPVADLAAELGVSEATARARLRQNLEDWRMVLELRAIAGEAPPPTLAGNLGSA